MDEETARSGELDRQQQERDPAEGPDVTADDAASDLPQEAIEEARRWRDVPMQDPEKSTGIDAG